MALQNRVTPFAEIEADPARGDFMGNRGILHGDTKQLARRRWAHKAWIICLTEFRGRRRQVMTPHRYTELFFLDEAVAIAAGHRPCYECRRPDFYAWQDAWRRAEGAGEPPRAGDMDRVLHRERIDPRTRRQQTWRGNLNALPDGTFIAIEDRAHLLQGAQLYPWTHRGYGPPTARPADHSGDGMDVTVLTPPSAVATLAAGFSPRLHQSISDRNI